jgi:hypothetical protein
VVRSIHWSVAQLACGLVSGKLWLGLRIRIPELNVGSKFYVLYFVKTDGLLNFNGLSL